MKLSNIQAMGRYRNPDTGTDVNVKVGRQVGRSVDVMFFIRSGKRVFINDREFWKFWTKVEDV